MAEGTGDDEDPFSFRNYSLKKDPKPSDDSDEADDSYLKPDLGIGNEPSFEKNGENYAPGEQHANPANEHPKREENPFSFKHFLKRDPGSGYHGTGARPKVFSNHHNESFSHLDTISMDSDPGLCLPRSPATSRHAGTQEFSSVLPDFVQDHLVVEQCYLNHSDLQCSPQQLGVNLENLENLPDFAINSSPDKNNRPRPWNDHRASEASDLPSFLQSPTGLPFDLPLVGECVDTTSDRSTGESGASKSLPDFLSDGPIHSSRLGEATQPGLAGDDQSPAGDAGDADLGRELEATRRQLLDKTRRVQALEKELLSIRSKDHEEMATLEKAIEQVEDNLKRSTRRAVTAESTVSKLKQEMKLLTKELNELRQENCALRFCQGDASTSPDDRQTQRLARELRGAATTAEQSLRSLLTGVNNLRVVASALENLGRVHDRTGDYLDDDEDAAGAAL